MIYVDEAGIGGEPVTAVVGVIIDADRQWLPVREHLRALARHYLPELPPDDVNFHIKDIRNRRGQFAGLAPETCRDIVEELISTPIHFQLPLAIGFVRMSTRVRLRTPPALSALWHATGWPTCKL